MDVTNVPNWHEAYFFVAILHTGVLRLLVILSQSSVLQNGVSMEFRTVIRPESGMRGLVSHGKPIVLVGSCFSDNIGACLRDELFDADVNPFGPIYNPLSIQRAFEVLKDNTVVKSESLIENGGLWHSFLFHSRYSAVNREDAAESMNRRIEAAAINLRNASVVIITLGTTRVFTLRATGDVVANCHKLPGSVFDVRYLTLDEVEDALTRTVTTIRSVNQCGRIIFTVSPLRYNEQGAHGNQLSKSTLMLAVDSVIRNDSSSLTSYFPAYEVMMDDLRDYRFYADDMKHPSMQAVRYIYQLFKDTYFDSDTLALASEGAAFTRRLAHRRLNGADVSQKDEMAEKISIAEAFISRFPELKHASMRYLNSLFNDGI